MTEPAIDARLLETVPHIEIIPASVHIGADIKGVDLRTPLSNDEVAAIRQALLKWKVVFFRNQELSHEQHVAFAKQFGDPTPAHVVFGGEEAHPAVYSIAKFRAANSNRASQTLRPWSGWHADITAAINPPFASILRGVTVPPYGGDTQWTNLVAAFSALSQPMQEWLAGLHGEHRLDADPDNKLAAIHPLVRVHPETDEKALYVSPGFLRNIVELHPHESERVMHMLWEHAVMPEYTVRFRWEPGSIAFWDNRSTAHLAPRDIFDTDFERQFYRVTLNGDVPVGVDGRRSELIVGREIASL